MLTQRQKDMLIEAILETVSELNPEDIFDKEILEDWALDNNFLKKDEA